MKFWWVSQNQTHNQEIGRGYIWAPKTNAKGFIPHHWRTLVDVAPGDIIFSFVGTFISAIGVVYSRAYESVKPIEYGKSGLVWPAAGWKADVLYSNVAKPIRPRDYMFDLGPLMPSKYSPIQSSGEGNQGYLFEISGDFGTKLLELTQAEVPPMPILHLEDLDFDHQEQDIIAQKSLRETEVVSLVMARRGQGIFRSRVATIEDECRVTRVANSKFLIASHIKPWSDATNEERTDGNNGLFLSPHVDKLFDGGFISFTKNGHMLVSEKLPLDVLQKWHIDPRENYGKFNSDQAYFLSYHQTAKFVA